MSWAAEPAGEGHTPLPSRGLRRPPLSGRFPLVQLLFPLTALWLLGLRPLTVPPEPPNTTQPPAIWLPYLLHTCACVRAHPPTHTHSIPSPLNRKRKLMETSQTMALRPPRGFACAPNELSLLEHETMSEKILDPGPVPENHPPSPISALCQAKPWRGQGGDTTCHWPSWREAWSWRWAFPLPAPAQQRGAHSPPHWLLLPVASRLSQTSVPMNWGKPGSAVGHGGGCR